MHRAVRRDADLASRPPGLRGWWALGVALALTAPAPAQWTTHRGNPQRTGSLDDQPGPAKPKVLWVYKSPESFIASPVPGDKVLYVGALGAFNTGAFHALSIETAPAERVLWSKAAPFIKRPTVCSAVLAGGLAVFGDGMHQTDDAILYGLDAQSGRSVWQLPIPGKLIHLECSPTVANGRLYFGSGDAGVMCADPARLVLDGRDVALDEAKALVAKRWAELTAQYEADKKKDPQFALPPSEDSLPKPAPKLVWQKGAKQWHVDAPTAATGDRVLVASAYLDAEKVGKRCLVCLKADDGATLWETALTINPWSGPTVADGLVLVGCSSIRYDTKEIPAARGEVVALDLASGQVRWRSELPGGVLSPVAVKDGLAIFTATDGKVRALAVADGKPKWTYDAGRPFFGGVAIAAGVVYACDLKVVLHAVGLADGKKHWTLDTTAEPAVGAVGLAFASPAVHQGRIYLATCNLEGAANQPSAVICVADESLAGPARPVEKVVVDKANRTLTMPCRIAPRKLPSLKETYPVEVIATHPAPRGQKAHETVVTVEVVPSEVHKALESLGCKAGKPARGLEGVAQGPRVSITLRLPGAAGQTRLIPIEKTLTDMATGKPLPALKWYFTGSAMKQPDPDRPFQVYGADLAGTLIALFPVTDDTVFQSDLTMDEESLLKLDTNRVLLPPEGTVGELVVTLEPETPAAHPAALPSAGGMAFRPLPPLVTAPVATATETFLPERAEPDMPPLNVRPATRALPSEGSQSIGLDYSADMPPLATAPARLEPRRLLAVSPPAHEDPPDPLAPLPSAGRPRSASIAAAYAGDANADVLGQVAISTTPPVRRGAAPFLRLDIPQPFGNLDLVRVTAFPPDGDPPAPDLDPPPVFRFPVQP